MTESGMEEDPAETLRTEDESPVVPETEEESGAVLSAAYDSVEEETLLSAASVTANGFTVDDNGKLTAYSGPGGNVTIPANVGGISVKSIGSSVFSNNQNLSKITIPSSVTEIGSSAFSG